MPRKTAADKASNSGRYYQALIADAEQSGEIDAPLTAAVRWLQAALRQKARDFPAEAPAAYQHATEQIAAYAAQIQHRTAKAAK